MKLTRTRICFILLLFVFNFQAVGQTAQGDTTLQINDTLKQEWDGLHLINKHEHDVLQVLSIVGRYHGQYWNVNADQGNASGWDNRRFFVGMEAVLFHHITAQIQIRFSEDFHPLYNGLYQAYLKWSLNKAVAISLGRVDFLFAGLERTISSTKIVTFERGLLSNQLWPGEVLGAIVQGESKDFTYHAALLGGARGDDVKATAEYKPGLGIVAGVSHKATLFYKTGSLHLDYLYNNGNSTIHGFEPYNHSLSLWHQGQIGPFSMGIDLTTAHGIEGNKSVMGIMLLPTYVVGKNLLRQGDALEAVLRYQKAWSNGDNGLYLQSRYEEKVVDGGSGNEYQAVYAGVNYLIFRHHLKVITGLEYSTMKDDALGQNSYKGWTYFAGVRAYL